MKNLGNKEKQTKNTRVRTSTVNCMYEHTVYIRECLQQILQHFMPSMPCLSKCGWHEVEPILPTNLANRTVHLTSSMHHLQIYNVLQMDLKILFYIKINIRRSFPYFLSTCCGVMCCHYRSWQTDCFCDNLMTMRQQECQSLQIIRCEFVVITKYCIFDTFCSSLKRKECSIVMFSNLGHHKPPIQT